MTTKKVPVKILAYTFLICVAIVVLFPIYVTVVTAFKTTAESTQNFFALPGSFYLGNFQQIMSDEHFWDYVKNSLMITIVAVGLISITVPMVSYAISREMKTHKYFKVIYVLILLSMFAPFQALMTPLTQLCTKLGIMNQGGLILIYLAFSLGQGVFLFSGYYGSIPLELEEAATIDGCTTTQTFFRIVFPLMKPITSTSVIFNTMWIWNDFIAPNIFLSTRSKGTIVLEIFRAKGQFSVDWPRFMTLSVVAIFPVVVFYLLMQKNIIKGLTAGAVKG